MAELFDLTVEQICEALDEGGADMMPLGHDRAGLRIQAVRNAEGWIIERVGRPLVNDGGQVYVFATAFDVLKAAADLINGRDAVYLGEASPAPSPSEAS